jgi:hypothetical protein
VLGALVEQAQDRVVGGVDLGAQLGQLLFQLFGTGGSLAIARELTTLDA